MAATELLCLTPQKPGHGPDCDCDLFEDLHPVGVPCPVPLEGGMCGCDEDDTPTAVCLGRECDCG